LPNMLKWHLGLLNSKVVWWFLGQIVTKMVGGAYAMQSPFVSQIPIPNATPEQAAAITTLVDRILEAKATAPTANVSALEAEIDRLVFDLYDLTEPEIEIVKGGQS